MTPEQTTKSKKIEAESRAMKKILGTLDGSQKTEYWKIWREYLQNKSKESKLLHQIDKLEMAIQASEYAKLGFTKNQIMPFFKSAKNEITDPKLRKILSEFM
jgi:putative hydrolase of HD superfamily